MGNQVNIKVSKMKFFDNFAQPFQFQVLNGNESDVHFKHTLINDANGLKYLLLELFQTVQPPEDFKSG